MGDRCVLDRGAAATLRYWPEIDGLRAVAVGAVVLFHAGVPGLTGGFVGVDVFFVISGFLITGLIADEVQAGRFSLLGFYERRARRILPALLTVAAACLVAGYFVLLPAEYRDLGDSLLATLGFVSNLYFLEDTSYFAAAAHTKPLLHTWSLAVEEQFYLLFPAALAVAFRRRLGLTPRRLCLGLLAASLLASELELGDDPAAAFYLLHTRGFELMIGAALALGSLPLLRRRAPREALAGFGLAAIAAAVAGYGETTPFPGLAALLPCLGAAAVIQAARSGPTLAGRLLAARPLVILGLLSYSLYLWHWPLLVLASLQIVRPMTGWETAAVLLAALLLAAASWRWIERPARRRGGAAAARRFALMAAAAAGLVAAGALVAQLGQGLPWRLPPEVVELAAEKERRGPYSLRCMGLRPLTRSEPCRLGDADAAPLFLYWGDSHGAALAPGIDAAARELGVAGIAALEGGCPPLFGLEPSGARDATHCRRMSDAVWQLIERSGVRAVVLHARWAVYVEGRSYGPERGRHFGFVSAPGRPNAEVMLQGLLDTVARLQAAGLAVYLVAGTPEIGVDVPLASARLLQGRAWDFAPTRADFEVRNAEALRLLREVAAARQLLLVEPHLLLCDAARCPVLREGRQLYFDDDHLSVLGAFIAAAAAWPVLSAIAAQDGP